MLPSISHNGQFLACYVSRRVNVFKSVKCDRMRMPYKLFYSQIKPFSIPSKCNRKEKHTSSQYFSGLSRHLSSVSSMATVNNNQGLDFDLKEDAVNIFKYAINSVRPRKMIDNVIHYDKSSSTIRVENRVYELNRNVFIVGFGKATLGMARAVEDVLGDHIVSGIISIPRGLPKEMEEAQQFDSLLSENTKIQTYESSLEDGVDEVAYNASKAINNLVTKLTEKDIIIVLCSGGGSALFPAPRPPITIEDLLETVKLLAHQGLSVRELSTVRQNIEWLKGGGLVRAAKPAMVVSLILSSIIGDSVDLMAGGPTYPRQPTPHHCLQILQRLGVKDKVPASVMTYLDKAVKEVAFSQSNEKTRQTAKKELESELKRVQNIIVGDNSMACEAAMKRATELGYLPLNLTNEVYGEAHKIGALYAKLAEFITVCFEHKVPLEINSSLAQLELDLVASGMKKQWLNLVIAHTEMAHHVNKDICIIAGGEMVVNVNGNGVGGKNMECALGAVSKLKNKFNEAKDLGSTIKLAFLSADTDGYDGVTKIAGAVIDNDFVANIAEKGYDVDRFLENNDSLTFFQTVNDGQNLIETKLTGTKVMDMLILLLKKPKM